MKTPIYLDYAAATPVDTVVLGAMQPYFERQFYNPSATYDAARSVKKDVEAARASVARALGARPSEIIFTAGGTEANNLAIQGVLEQFPESNIVVSAIEHESVLAPARQYKHRLAPVDTQAIVDVEALIKLIDDHTVLISVMYANNEVGSIQPIKEIAVALKRVRRERLVNGNQLPIYFHSDAAQATNYLDLHVSRLGVDMMTLNGGKIYGPKASGALFMASHVTLRPQIVGGGQERGQRSGTENVPAIIGFAKALLMAQSQRRDEALRLATLQKACFASLKEKLPDVIINGSLTRRLPNNVHITLPGQDNERLLIQLDETGIIGAAGSACSASDEEPSHVLTAMGISDGNAQSSLRLTMGRSTDAAAIHTVVRTLERLVTTKQ